MANGFQPVRKKNYTVYTFLFFYEFDALYVEFLDNLPHLGNLEDFRLHFKIILN